MKGHEIVKMTVKTDLSQALLRLEQIRSAKAAQRLDEMLAAHMAGELVLETEVGPDGYVVTARWIDGPRPYSLSLAEVGITPRT